MRVLSDVEENALLEAAMEARRAHAALAREDGSEFCSFVLKNDKTGQPIKQAPLHKAWHRLAEKYKRLLIWSHVEAGKTTQLVIGRVLYELAKNPNIRIAIVSNTAGQGQRSLQAIAKYIEKDPELHEVAPDLLPDAPWTNSQLYVKRDSLARDPSVQVCGVHGNILGSRIDLLIMDDVLDYENTRTPAARHDLWKWYNETLVGRLTKDARVIVVGNAWHPDDLLHRLAREPAWTAFRFPVIDETGRVLWPDEWPTERIEAKREELAGDPSAFARSMMCLARDDSDSRFKEDWIKLCLGMGRGKSLVHQIGDLYAEIPGLGRDGSLPKGYGTFTGVDLAVKKKDSAGRTVLFSGLRYPDGKKRPLGIESGRWTGEEILQRMKAHHQRYRSVLIVEDNAAQEFIAQFASARLLPVRPFTTGKNKHHPEYGVESIATELARGEWIIPCTEVSPGQYAYHSEIGMWISSMLFYDPNGHTGDHLMASWFFREGARGGMPKVKRGKIDLLTR